MVVASQFLTRTSTKPVACVCGSLSLAKLWGSPKNVSSVARFVALPWRDGIRFWKKVWERLLSHGSLLLSWLEITFLSIINKDNPLFDVLVPSWPDQSIVIG